MGDSDDEEYPVSIPKKQRLDESDVDTDDDVVDQEIDPEEEEESPNGSLGLTTSLEFGQSIKDFKEHLMRPDGGKKVFKVRHMGILMFAADCALPSTHRLKCKLLSSLNR